MIVRSPVALAAVAATLVGCCACTGSSRPPEPPAATSAAGHTYAAQRWWSNHAASSGSSIAANGPDAAVVALRPSRTDYCGMLRQTTAAGKSLFAGVAPGDAGMQATVRAFVAEISAVAPSDVARAWHALGKMIVAVSASGGDLGRVSGVNTGRVRAAAATIAADAATQCHLKLTS